MKNLVGKNVWLLDGDIKNGLSLGSKELYTIKKVKSGKECHDWSNHYIIEKDGKKLEVSEYQCVFPLNETGNKSADIEKYLTENGISLCSVSEHEDNTISAEIEGDWKHEHGWSNDLMSYIGYDFIDEDVIEDVEDDYYVSTHFYGPAA